ncbi:MAG: hypothetical protein ACRDFX_09595 [Chloroflexota bacterium]
MFRRAGQLLVLPLILLIIAGCGSQNRSSLAQQTVKSYWDAVGHLKLSKAYAMLSPGDRTGFTQRDFRQSMFGFLTKTEGLSVDVGKPTLVGDCALVPVHLHAPAAPGGSYPAFQNLYWLNGAWSITTPSGGLTHESRLTSCPTGA